MVAWKEPIERQVLGTGQQHWSTVHAADLADFFRRALEDESAPRPLHHR